MLERAWTPARLRDGTVTDYGYGGPKWALVPYAKDRLTFENTSTIGEMRRDAKGRIVAFAMQTLRGRSKNVITRVDVAPR
ncbi:MAG: hypothetical protein JF589_08725 [Gemmatimonadetes bacterium]|nr:hypothetical protein [Gemmatimonadota bacterium]